MTGNLRAKRRTTLRSVNLGNGDFDEGDKSDAAEVIRFIEENCYVPEGKDVGKPLKVAPFMRQDIVAIYNNPRATTRRAIISRGRKNAKTVEAALLMLAHLVGPMARPNSGLYSSALSRDQAAITFKRAAQIVRLSPTLSPYVQIVESHKLMACPALGTEYRALSADASTNLGLSPSFVVHDELGQVKGPMSDLYEAIETATQAQENPLSIIISTQAVDNNDLLSILIDDAQTGSDPRTVLRMNTAPDHLDPFTVAAVKAANPAFNIFMNQAEVMGMLESAKRLPSRQAAFENYILNRRVEAFQPFVSKAVWQLNGKTPVNSFKGLPVYGGLDLSECNDLTALVLQAPVDGTWHVRPTFWLPGVGLRERSRLDRREYDVWAKQGHLVAIEGSKTVDFSYVAQYLRVLCDTFDVRKIAFDRWGFRHLKPWLVQSGFTEREIESIFVEFGQGMQSMSPALRELESLLLNGKMAHGNHPVLSMCAANAVVQRDPAGNRKLTKAKSRGRIDGMVSLAMATSVAGTHIEKKIETSTLMGVF
jgi:phage terminase large subunit-like protein